MSEHEPKRLRRGKAFHKKLQKEWHEEAQGVVEDEYSVSLPNGRKGRMDIHVTAGNQFCAVVEIKASDWDSMTPSALRRNARRQIRQIWKYIDSQLEAGHSVSPGVIFPELPSDPEVTALIESIFNEEDIQVVWHTETIAELRKRLGSKEN